MVHLEKSFWGGRADLRGFGGLLTRIHFENRSIVYFEKELWGGRADGAFEKEFYGVAAQIFAGLTAFSLDS